MLEAASSIRAALSGAGRSRSCSLMQWRGPVQSNRRDGGGACLLFGGRGGDCGPGPGATCSGQSKACSRYKSNLASRVAAAAPNTHTRAIFALRIDAAIRSLSRAVDFRGFSVRAQVPAAELMLSNLSRTSHQSTSVHNPLEPRSFVKFTSNKTISISTINYSHQLRQQNNNGNANHNRYSRYHNHSTGADNPHTSIAAEHFSERPPIKKFCQINKQ